MFGFVASPFILGCVLRNFAETLYDRELKAIIQNQFYVDNMLVTSNSSSHLLSLYNKLTSTMGDAGFDMQEWITNSIDITKDTDLTTDPCKVLGYEYYPMEDSLKLKNCSLNVHAKSKRQVLSSVAGFFDPIGIVNPILLPPKLFIRKLHSRKLGWDEPLDDDLQKEWSFITKNFNSNESFSFPRKAYDDSRPVSLVVFCDSSKLAYGCVIYVIQNNCSKLFSKLKLAPCPSKTLPSLELLAVYLGFQSILTITTDVNFTVSIDNITFLSDSQVALSWLISGKAQKKNIFVNNRLAEIRKFSENFKSQNINLIYKYVPTDQNMADVITRGVNVSNFKTMYEDWVGGPSWLVESDWPSGNLGCIPCSKLNVNEFPKINEYGVLCAQLSCQNKIINANFSSYSKLFGTVTNLFKFSAILKSKVSNVKFDLEECKNKAFAYLIKSMQYECFAEQLELLGSNEVGSCKIIKNYNLFLDEFGIIRAKCRLEHSLHLSYDQNNPILLGNHNLSRLLIKKFHFQVCHLGLESTLSKLRSSGLVLLSARTRVNSVLRECLICNKFNCRAGKSPFVPSLPPHRVNLTKPFGSTGIDYTGHFYIREGDAKVKAYILIFTCLTTRSVHLELLSMDTEDFVLAFLRFSNRYSIPREVFTDNARTFLAGASMIKNLTLSSSYRSHFSTENVVFKTIPTYSPWYGACWERLIRTVKSCIYKTIGRNIFSFDCFVTLLTDIQNSINSRPLYYKSSNDIDFEVITPNHFLYLYAGTSSSVFLDEFSLESYEPEEVREALLNSLSCREIIINKFNSVWFERYLMSLKHPLQGQSNPDDSNFKIDQVVLVKVPNKPRPFWHLGRIIELLPGTDQEVRVCKVKKSDSSEVVTSVENLFPL